LARSRRTARRRAQGHVPAGRVCGRPVARARGHGNRRVPEPGAVLPAHLHHRGHASAARLGGQAPVGQGWRPGHPVADGLRRRQDAHDAGGLSPGQGRGAGQRPARRSGHPGRGADHGTAARSRCGAGRHQVVAQPTHQARWAGGAHAVGRPGVAAGRRRGLRSGGRCRHVGHLARQGGAGDAAGALRARA
jgi:hypothetical protein